MVSHTGRPPVTTSSASDFGGPWSWDYRRLDAFRRRTYGGAMAELDAHLLERALSLAALIAGAAQYAGLMRRREGERRWTEWKAEADRTGLQGLVRVFAANN